MSQTTQETQDTQDTQEFDFQANINKEQLPIIETNKNFKIKFGEPDVMTIPEINARLQSPQQPPRTYKKVTSALKGSRAQYKTPYNRPSGGRRTRKRSHRKSRRTRNKRKNRRTCRR